MNAKKYYALSAVMCFYIGLATKNKNTASPPVALKAEKITKTKEIKKNKGPAPEKTIKAKVIRTVSIENGVTDDMICYKKLNQKYKPDTFIIRVNGTPLFQDKKTEISVTNDKINIEYDFSFARGWYKGTRKSSFKLDSKTDSTTLTFEWNDEHRISLSGAKVDVIS